jgi:hypothetical protein
VKILIINEKILKQNQTNSTKIINNETMPFTHASNTTSVIFSNEELQLLHIKKGSAMQSLATEAGTAINLSDEKEQKCTR